MPGGISAAQAQDLVTATLNAMERGSFSQTFANTAGYPVLKLFFGSGKLKSISGGATQYEKRIRVDENYSARGSRLYDTSSYTRRDVLRFGRWPIVMHQAEWTFDLGEAIRNQGGEQLVELLTVERDACYESIANYFENRLILPPDSPTDDINPQGVMFHIRMLAAGLTDPVGGRNGYVGVYGDGQVTNLVGGNDASLASNGRLKNWAFTHDGVMSPRLVAQCRTAINRTRQQAPRGFGKFAADAGNPPTFVVLMNQQMAESYTDMVNAGPDDRNGDIAPFTGDRPMHGVPTMGIPTLNDVANVPIYGVPLKTLTVKPLKGAWMTEDKPIRHPNQRRVVINGIDSQYVVVHENPANSWVGHTPR